MSKPAGRNRAMWYVTPVLALIVAAAATTIAAAVRPAAPHDAAQTPTASPAGCGVPARAMGLRDLAAPCGFAVGTALNDVLFDDPTYRETAAREYNSVTPESAMKWGTVEPRPGEFNFAPGDALVQVAQRNGQSIHGHTLVWHLLPGWVADGGYQPAELREILQRHVQTTVGHWRGQVSSWDVVNEPINGDGTLRDSVWMRGLGPDYIADALRWARAADPGAKLFINDFDIEGVNPKSDRLYRLVRDLRAGGVPIDGVGFQTHLTKLELPDTFEANLRRFADLGVQVAITEMDVRLPVPPTAQQLTAQAALYARALKACVRLVACRSFTTWGFTDLHSWVDAGFPGQGAALPFDASYGRKPAYEALYKTLAAGIPKR